MTTSVLSRNDGESAQPVPRAMLFANGSLTAFDQQVQVHRFERRNADGSTQKVAQYKRVPIFRSGVFADSMGMRKEWLPEQMHQMASNFEYLKRTGIFADVPVRVGHPSFLGGNPLKDVIGYFESLEVEDRKSPIDGDDETYTYLLATYEILDEDADRKITAGLYRNRSSEIGTFFTNDPESELWPVMMGVAFVDIPAVQGLNGFAKQNQTASFSIQLEAPVTGTDTAKTPPVEAPKPALPVNAEFTIGGTRTNDFARVQNYISELEHKNSEFTAQIASLSTENSALKEFKSAQIKAGRETRLQMLTMSQNGKPPVLTAPELEQEKQFAAMLDDAQFDAYLKRLEAKGGNPLLASHGYQSTDENLRSEDTADKAKAAEIDTLKGVISGFRYSSGMSTDKIKETDAFKKLVALDPTFTLA